MDQHNQQSASRRNSASTTNQPQDTLLGVVQSQVLERAAKNYFKSGRLGREDAIALDWTFGNGVVIQAMELVDRELVSILKSPSEKVLISVRGSTENETYWIIPGSTVCQCRSFVIGIRPICKHIIAAHFALETNEFDSISDHEVKSVYKKYFQDCNFAS